MLVKTLGCFFTLASLLYVMLMLHMSRGKRDSYSAGLYGHVCGENCSYTISILVDILSRRDSEDQTTRQLRLHKGL